MAWRAKDAVVHIVDVGRSMRVPYEPGNINGATRAEVALGVAKSGVQQRLLFAPKTEVGVVFLGTEETKNDLQADGYQNVLVVGAGSIEPPSLDIVRAMQTVPPGGATTDLVNGLIVAIDLMIKKTQNFRYHRTIVLYTDGASSVAGDEDLLECFKELERTSTKLIVTLVGGSATDVTTWTSLAEQCGMVELMRLDKLARDCSVCVKPVEQRAKVRLPLVISPDLAIPIGVYSKTTWVRLPTLKRRSKLAAAVPAEHKKTDNVIADRTYHVADDPDGEEVQREDRIKGHRYGQSIVPMSEYDEAALMYTCDRTLTALGFAPAASIGPEHSIHHVEVVAADKGDRWAYCAFESLIGAMLAEDRVLIARYCFRKNAQPRMVAMFPERPKDNEAASLTMQYLPFCEDLRDWPFASLPVPSEAQREAVAKLVDAVDLNGAGPNGATELLRPEDVYNPSLRRFYDFLVQRALKPGIRVPPVAREAIGVSPPIQIVERLRESGVAEQLVAQFGLTRVEKQTKKTRKFWREAVAEKRKDAGIGEVDVKKIRVDAVAKKDEKDEKEEDRVKTEPRIAHPHPSGAAASSAVMAQPVLPPPQVHIGSVNPERDFERWLATRVGGVDTVGPAVAQMSAMIERFADEGEDFLGKALSCLTVLRRGCVAEGEANAFNELLRKLRGAASLRRQRLWQRARDAQIGLITDAEVPTSLVTAEEARAFLAGDESGSRRETAAVPCAGALLSDKDLEDMIE